MDCKLSKQFALLIEFNECIKLAQYSSSKIIKCIEVPVT